ncbi:hypothetical protein M501DRAFT_930880 [Patellaria atrata CBS 101060]|uniref:SWR1-complex protein 4 n=1 Tax=Patellaria atrata CBS 101060 TaxID=1346257 RepID=A0A9P4SDU4_9PEZI|nr:hypothetical protein M501DRAFT_930880 [Patellaria atrata CBS 101060]
MASRKDVQDIMGLSGAAPANPPPTLKKPKTATGKRTAGIAREVLALHGDRPPPVAVIDVNKTYKGRPSRAYKLSNRWRMTPFTNQARTDGLVLKHWAKIPASKVLEDSENITMEDVSETKIEEQPRYEWAKCNVQVEIPQYTDEEYETYLRSDDWSREETDYLLQAIKEYHQRWPVIYDRYDFKPSALVGSGSDDMTLVPTSPRKERSIEDMKARYYNIQAKAMAIKTPITNMNPAEFALYENLTKYNPVSEASRKKLANNLMSRSLDEAKEEEFLLNELQRIAVYNHKFETERAEIRARLEAPSSTGTAMQFQSSQALHQLFTQLFHADRSRKRGSRLSVQAGMDAGMPTPATVGQTPVTAGSHRDSIGGTSQKKSGVPGSATSQTAQTPVRTISPRSETRFGITTHDRLTSGVTFRTDRVLKLRQAKSAAQTQKIATALAELKVPDIIVLPTTTVCESLERLVGQVSKLLDVRKVREKEEGELAVARARAGINTDNTQAEKSSTEKKAEVEDIAKGTDAEADANSDGDAHGDEDDDGDVDGDGDAGADVDEEDEAEEDEADGDAEDEKPLKDEMDGDVARARSSSNLASGPLPENSAVNTARGGHKRSASVLSATSTKSSKRTRK